MPCHSHREGRLGVLERGHAGQDLTLEELERGAAAGGDVRHLLREASLLDSRDGVAAADDGDAAVLAGDLSEGVGNVEGALGESLELEDAHGAVPDDGLALLELGLDHLGRLGSVVQAKLEECKTVIWNGPMGVFEFEAFAKGTFDIADTLAEITSK